MIAAGSHSGVGGGVTAVQPLDGLSLGAGVRRDVTIDVDERTEQIWVLHGRRLRAQVPPLTWAHDAPVRRVIADAEIGDHVRRTSRVK